YLHSFPTRRSSDLDEVGRDGLFQGAEDSQEETMALAHEASRVREILAAARLEHVRYAIRDIAVLAEQLAREGKTVLPLNIGDPLKFDFRTPPHLIEAVV